MFGSNPGAGLIAVLACTLGLAGPVSSQEAIEDTAIPPPPEGSVSGLGDINLFPKRIVIDSRRGIAQIGLYNRTVNSGDYAINVIDMSMTPEGQVIAFDNGLSEEAKAQVNTASQFLRYSPRRVTLQGGDSQLVRVMARAPADIPDGEYRSHFLVTAIPPSEGGGSIEDVLSGNEATGIGVTIRPRFGISIPIIIRVGDTTLESGIANPRLVRTNDGRDAIAMEITRSGTRSSFGDVVITAQGSDVPVAIARGVGVYPEVDQRLVVIPINPESRPSALVAGTRWTIIYTDDDFEPGARLAETTFIVP